MPTNTPNYGLIKPAQSEQYNINVDNANMDLLDSAIDAINDKVQSEDRTTSAAPYVQAIGAGGISANIAHGLGRLPKHIGITQWGGASLTPLTLVVDDTSLTTTNFKLRANISSTGADFVGNVKISWIAT